MNQVNLEGHAGADAETKYLPDGKAVTNLRLATAERWKGKDGKDQERTEWHRIVCFGYAAERAASIRKGQKIVVLNGKIRTRSWDDKDGKKQYITEVEAHQVYQIATEPKSERQGQAANRPGSPEVSEDDIPF